MGDAGSQDVMVPVGEADVARMAQILALRTMGDNQKRTNDSLDRLGEKVDKIGLDLAGLKAIDHSAEIATIQGNLDAYVTLMREDNKDRDQRLERLLEASLEDRKKLWLENAARAGEIKNLADRVLPIFTSIGAAVAVVISIVLDKALK